MAPHPSYPESRFERRELERKDTSLVAALREERAAPGAAAALGFSYQCDKNNKLFFSVLFFFSLKFPHHNLEIARCRNRKPKQQLFLLLLQYLSMTIFITFICFCVFAIFIMHVYYFLLCMLHLYLIFQEYITTFLIEFSSFPSVSSESFSKLFSTRDF